MKIIQYLINGISIGSVYAIIALGYTMVYGIAKMLNFAHGDVIMVGAYISFCVTNYLGLPVAVSILAAMAVCTVLGVLIEGLAYKPLRGTPSLAVLITAIGVSYFLHCDLPAPAAGRWSAGGHRRGDLHHCCLHPHYGGSDLVYHQDPDR